MSDSRKLRKRRLFCPLVAALILLACVRAGSAQLCPGSHIYLVVRDEHGQVIDPTPLTTRRHSARTFDFVKVQADRSA